jgi:metallo-beta-lactamase family protein
MIVGYQAPGSPGRLLQDGAPHARLGGVDVRIKAKIETFVGWSAHADRDELLKFAEAAQPQSGGRTKTFFIALGEPATARFFAQRVHDYLGATAIVPVQGDSFLITKEKVTRIQG